MFIQGRNRFVSATPGGTSIIHPRRQLSNGYRQQESTTLTLLLPFYSEFMSSKVSFLSYICTNIMMPYGLGLTTLC